jgi:hypothetical protein
MKLAPLDDMWPHYPIGTKGDVASLIGGNCAKNILTYDWDTCCIRLSRALNYSARPITGFSGIANPGLGKDAKVRASKGADDKYYIYSCYDLKAYLDARFGYAKKFSKSYEDADLSGVKGVIMFGMRHVDLWNGSEVRYNTDFTDGTKTVKEIRVWEAA